ncbi:hypothetical protein Pla22_08050 [Rubripirellula amarantea]|uniref:Methylamine utilization protein n=1 Tax=Rubripirellula amarantea TaxID=2527999 RepID=A0A5C5WRM2_9BACT|nr:methylamine utilization protein [Rubripirellula amarantea]TWT53177.1 hypothetical protein Pla22_08050 [Rubripirellula amarantea]
MKNLTACLIAAATIGLGGFLGTSSASAETGDLKVTFKYAGDAPTPAKTNVTADAQYCGKFDLIDESLLVNKDNNGIKNVVFYVYTGRRDPAPKFAPVDPKVVVLANQDCRFEPHIAVAMKGDTLKVDNPDEVGHNANMQFFNNKAQNPNIPAGQSVSVELTDAEPAPTNVTCNIHPWMKSYVVVLDHPFVSVSDDNGEVTIKGLPAGEKFNFRIFHESVSFKEVDVNGEKVKLKRGALEIEIKPGENDFGTITLGG